MAEKNGYRGAGTGRGTEALTQKKEDRARMEAAKAVHDQLNSKTVGPPLAATGLIGDQAPESTIGVGDFDQVRNQIYLQTENAWALDTLNTMGQLTNMQSQSGPIPGTQFVSQTSITASGDTVIDAPDAGSVWQLTAASVGTLSSGTNTILLLLNDVDTSASVLLEKVTAAQTQFDLNEPVFVSYPCRIVANLDAYTSGTTTVRVSLIRIR